jgi:phage terminase small subunit
MPKYGLTEKQRRFCEEYLVDLNATQAATRAGYSPKTAYRIGHELLQKTSVQECVRGLRAEQSKRTCITADDVVNELKNVAFAQAEILGRDKVKALELLGKHLGMFTDRVSVVDEDEIPKLLEALKE